MELIVSLPAWVAEGGTGQTYQIKIVKDYH